MEKFPSVRKVKENGSMKLGGSRNLRMRLLLSTLTSKPITIRDIRADAMPPGLLDHEVSLLYLLAKISVGCVVQINETGTNLRYRPGTVMGGNDLEHDCGTSRSIGYFLEPLIVLGLFGQKRLTITLKGITNDSKDPSVDTFRTTTLPLLKKFGIPSEHVDLKIESRGVSPLGGGKVALYISPFVHDTLKAITWIDEGLVESVRGFTFSARVPGKFEHKMLQAAHKIFDPLLRNVHINTDHKAGTQAGKSPGSGISLVARLQQAVAILLIQQSTMVVQMKWMTSMMRRKIRALQTITVNKLHWPYSMRSSKVELWIRDIRAYYFSYAHCALQMC